MILYLALMFVVMRPLAAMTPTQAADPANAISFANSGAGILLSIFGLFWLAMLVPMIAVQVRRLHDTNRSGWWLGAFWLLYVVYIAGAFATVFSLRNSSGSPPNLAGAGMFGILGLVFFVYSIVLFVFFCLRGTSGPNRFGDDPYGADVGEVFA
jgi:uncharacterized membrane protein YhaH (DUF805 family)